MRWLLDQSSDAIRDGHEYPGGLPDIDVLAIARREQRILLTDDRDFGDLVFRRRQPHIGVIYFRVGDHVSLATKLARLDYVLDNYTDHLDEFIVCTLHRVRIRRP